MDVHEESFLSDSSSSYSTLNTRALRRPGELSWKEKVFLVSTLVLLVVIICITIARLATLSDSGEEHGDFIFNVAIFFNLAFCILYLAHGVLTSRASEMLILTVVLAFLVVYFIGNYITGDHNGAKMARLIISSLSTPWLVILGLYIGWEYYKEKRLVNMRVGDNPTWQRLYQYLMLFQDLLKLDFQLSVTMITLTAAALEHMDAWDIVSMAFGYPFLIIFLGLGFYAFQRESMMYVNIFFGLSLLGISYTFYGFYVVSTYIDANPGLAWAAIGCAIAFLGCRLCMGLLSVAMIRSFGSGLKDRLNP